MADNKKAVLLYCDVIHTFESLEDDEAGRLIKHFLRYVNDKNPVAPDRITQIAFEPIKQQLKRDLVKWEGEQHSRSEAGKKGMANRWNKVKQAITNDNTVTKNITNITDTVNVTVNDNVIKKVITKKEKQEIKKAVLATPEEVEKLKEKFGAGYLWAVETLSNYKQSSGKKYKSDYHTLIGWVYEKFLKEKNIPNGNTNDKIGRIDRDKVVAFINGTD